MKSLLIITGLLILISCSHWQGQKQSPDKEIVHSEIYSADLQQIIDSSSVSGSVLLYDPQTRTSWSNDFTRCDSGFLRSLLPGNCQENRPQRMNAYLKKLNYGNMDADSANIDVFWLEGDSRISMN